MLSRIFEKNDKTLIFKELHYFDNAYFNNKEYLPYNEAINHYAKLLCINELEPWNHKLYSRYITQYLCVAF